MQGAAHPQDGWEVWEINGDLIFLPALASYRDEESEVILCLSTKYAQLSLDYYHSVSQCCLPYEFPIIYNAIPLHNFLEPISNML